MEINRRNLSTTHAEPPTCCQADTRNDITDPADVNKPADGLQIARLSIAGMRCGACAGRIQGALETVEGVASANVVFAESAAKVRFDPERTDIRSILAAVRSAGYDAGPVEEKPAQNPTPSASKIGAKPVIIGMIAAVGILGFYLGLITLTSDWYNAKAQFGDYRWWVLALAVGVGVQIGLFVHLRTFISGACSRGATSSVAASGGMTTLSMALCCSHYVAAFLPAIGLPFLSTAAAGLSEYQVQFFMLGVISNLFGIGYMLRLMAKNGLVFASWTHRPA